MKLSLLNHDVLYKVMKITFSQIMLTLLLTGMCYAKESFGQKILEKKVSISIQNQSLDQALQDLTKIADIKFIYSKSIVETGQMISIDTRDKLGNILNELLVRKGIRYSLINNLFVLSKNPGISQPAAVTEGQQLLPEEIVQSTVKGKVTDEKGEPLPGVSVSVKGTATVVSTDQNGNFSTPLPNGNAVLIFSYIGFVRREINVNNQTTVNVSLAAELKSLSEVVVTGYTTQNRHKLTSAVASVTGDDLNRRVATTPVSLLQGQLPGLQVTQSSGEPGAEGMQLVIRGLGSFGASSGPLIIVNGVPGNLDMLNPNDIESVSILKDAASAAIYGSRGANGVIVVKTKRGQAGRLSLQYNYNFGIANATRLPDVIDNSALYMQLSNEARTNSSLTPIYSQAQIDLYQNATDRVKYPNHNWLDDLFEPAHVQNHYLNVAGGKDSTTYSLGLGVTKQPGTMIGFDYKKYTLALGLNSKATKRITIGADIQARYGDKSSPVNGAEDQFLSTLAHSPLYPPRAADGRWIKAAFQNEVTNKNSIMVATEDAKTRTQNYYTQGNLSLGVKIIDGLTWENKGAVSYESYKIKSYTPLIQAYYWPNLEPAGINGIGSSGLYAERYDIVYATFYSQLNYNKTFGDHTISAFGGYQEEQNTFSNLQAYRNQFVTDALKEINAGPTEGQTNGGTSQQWALRSMYASVNYDYKDKYLIGATIRRDGTSRLPSYSRYGTFYSFSGAWRVSKENLLKDVSWINDLKIRASYGQLGNQDIGVYPYQATLGNAAYPIANTVQSGFIPSSLVDPNLKWETTRTFDVGLDVTAFNKLSITADWFNKYTFDILRASQVPVWIGLYPPTINNGALRNTGFEIATQYKDKIGKDFSYNIGLNFQRYKNKLEDFGATEKGGDNIREEGHELDEYYLYIWDGIFQNQAEIDSSPRQPVTPTPGDLKIKDVNGDGVISDADRTYVKGRYPSFQYALNAGAAWKGIDFSVQFYGTQGQKTYVRGWGIEPFRQGSIPTKDWLNRWTPTNPTNDMPKIYVADSYSPVQNYTSTYFLKNSSFLRMKSVQLGYTLPSRLLGKITARSLRLYATADNVFTITKYPGLDPERGGNGNYVTYPQNRTLTFGATVQF